MAMPTTRPPTPATTPAMISAVWDGGGSDGDTARYIRGDCHKKIPVTVWMIVCDDVDTTLDTDDDVDFDVGVGTAVRIPPLGRLVTTLSLLNVINSGDSS